MALIICGGKPGIVPQEIKGWWVIFHGLFFPWGKPWILPRIIKRVGGRGYYRTDLKNGW